MLAAVAKGQKNREGGNILLDFGIRLAVLQDRALDLLNLRVSRGVPRRHCVLQLREKSITCVCFSVSARSSLRGVVSLSSSSRRKFSMRRALAVDFPIVKSSIWRLLDKDRSPFPHSEPFCFNNTFTFRSKFFLSVTFSRRHKHILIVSVLVR